MLPKDICIESINLVSNNDHARFDAYQDLTGILFSG
ncbi:MAG: hypothetical protein CM15mP102_11630 [Flavobacteriales bacterium]|nr:MAG: hypothetical protein CM15mP102_11630 [Flavobacteriales bacterium]